MGQTDLVTLWHDHETVSSVDKQSGGLTNAFVMCGLARHQIFACMSSRFDKLLRLLSLDHLDVLLQTELKLQLVMLFGGLISF